MPRPAVVCGVVTPAHGVEDEKLLADAGAGGESDEDEGSGGDNSDPEEGGDETGGGGSGGGVGAGMDRAGRRASSRAVPSLAKGAAPRSKREERLLRRQELIVARQLVARDGACVAVCLFWGCNDRAMCAAAVEAEMGTSMKMDVIPNVERPRVFEVSHSCVYTQGFARLTASRQLCLVRERNAMPLDARNEKNNREWRENLVRASLAAGVACAAEGVCVRSREDFLERAPAHGNCAGESRSH